MHSETQRRIFRAEIGNRKIVADPEHVLRRYRANPFGHDPFRDAKIIDAADVLLAPAPTEADLAAMPEAEREVAVKKAAMFAELPDAAREEMRQKEFEAKSRFYQAVLYAFEFKQQRTQTGEKKDPEEDPNAWTESELEELSTQFFSYINTVKKNTSGQRTSSPPQASKPSAPPAPGAKPARPAPVTTRRSASRRPSASTSTATASTSAGHAQQ
jgi:hypothetical protein